MHHFDKTLHVATQGMYLRLEGDAVRAEREDSSFVRLPLNQIGAVHVYGRVGVSTSLIRRFADDGIDLAFFTRNGSFSARLSGGATGNVLLRCAQHEFLHRPEDVASLARTIVAAKILNSRVVVLDLAKDGSKSAAADHRRLAQSLADLADGLRPVASLDEIRGVEGQAARMYLHHLGALPRDDVFRFRVRSRRPSLDPMNSLLSFLYALLRSRCAGAAQGAGLDPQVGYLHGLRPGRDSLALDLMEELRAPFVDRLALTLVNRRQLREAHFVTRPGGAVELNDDGRSMVLNAWDAYLSEHVHHRVADRTVERRYVPHLQATVLARRLRGDIDQYLPFRTIGR